MRAHHAAAPSRDFWQPEQQRRELSTIASAFWCSGSGEERWLLAASRRAAISPKRQRLHTEVTKDGAGAPAPKQRSNPT